MNREPDWALWRSFAAVVEHGSLSAAARAVGLSQPTLGRHVETLEQDLGVPLFERTLSGLKPNETALSLFEPVDAARRAIAEAGLRAAGAEADPGGTVRITASAMVSNYVLPPILADIRARLPLVAIESVPSDSAENLLLREADIAVRMFRPTQLELVARKLGEIEIVPCAHADYLERRGTPRVPADLAGHDLVGFDRSEAIIAHSRAIGTPLSRADFAVRTDDQTHLWELLRAGLGIGFGQRQLVARTPGMRMLDLDLSIPPMEVWLTAHRELFTSRRIRAIYDALATGLALHLAESAVPPAKP